MALMNKPEALKKADLEQQFQPRPFLPLAAIGTVDSSSVVEKTPKSINFSLEPHQVIGYQNKRPYKLQINGRTLCDLTHWAFHCCGLMALDNFKSYTYDHTSNGIPKENARTPYDQYTNWELLELYHEKMFQWMKKCSPDQYNPEEFLMVLSDIQVRMIPKMLSHKFVREVDSFMNKSHGPSRLHLYRISLREDWPTK